jgi:hypothetical protein
MAALITLQTNMPDSAASFTLTPQRISIPSSNVEFMEFIIMLAKLTCIAILPKLISDIRTVAILVLKIPPALRRR